jgi:hypothetical protein
MPRHKRHRGGQPGNRNARKHGFYSTHHTPEEIKRLCEVIKNDDKDPAFSALRLKVENAIADAPGNYRVLREGSSLLVKYLCAKRGIDDARGKTLMKRVFRDTLKAVAAGDLDLTERIASQALKDVEKLPND